MTPFEALPFLPLLTKLWYTFLWVIGLLEIEVEAEGGYCKSTKTIKLYVDNLWKASSSADLFAQRLVKVLEHELKHHLGYKHTRAERKNWRVTTKAFTKAFSVNLC